jgi:hypothetical protein
MTRRFSLLLGPMEIFVGLLLLANALATFALSEGLGDRPVQPPPGCPHKAASQALGSCVDAHYLACSSFETQNSCQNPPGPVFEVKQDFPVECVFAPDWKCNQPDRNCWRYTTCIWDPLLGCVEDPNNDNPWYKKKKFESARCAQ